MTEAQTKELPVIKPAERAATALKSDSVGKDLAALVESSKSITAITNDDGRTECHAAAMKARAARVAIEKAGKDARDDATAFSKAVIAEEKRLVAIIEPEQDRLLKLRDEWDAKIEAEKAAKAEEERMRVAGIRERITHMGNVAVMAVGAGSEAIAAAVRRIEEIVIGEPFAEFATEAEGVKRATLSRLSDLLAAALAREAEAARLAEEKRIADEKAERERLEREAEAKRQREENERIRLENEAAAAKLKAEREEFERLQAKAKAEQEEAERQRKAAEESTSTARAADRVGALISGSPEPAAQPAAIAVTQAIPPAPAVAAAPDNGRYIRLGEINALLGFTVTGEFLAGLGFVGKQDKNARLYRECDFPLICRAIVEHVAMVASVPAAMRRAAA